LQFTGAVCEWLARPDAEPADARQAEVVMAEKRAGAGEATWATPLARRNSKPLRRALIASKPASIRGFARFYQIGSQPG